MLIRKISDEGISFRAFSERFFADLPVESAWPMTVTLHRFKTGETYTTIHYPGSTVTRAFGINERGDIVGNYVLGGVTRAFLAREVED